jgi:hypothetical protein
MEVFIQVKLKIPLGYMKLAFTDVAFVLLI